MVYCIVSGEDDEEGWSGVPRFARCWFFVGFCDCIPRVGDVRAADKFILGADAGEVQAVWLARKEG